MKPAVLIALIGLASLVAVTCVGVSAEASSTSGAVRNGLIVFGSDRTTPRNEEIYIMNPDGSGERQLTTSPGHDSGPVWSPDGQRLAFFSRRNRSTRFRDYTPGGLARCLAQGSSPGIR